MEDRLNRHTGFAIDFLTCENAALAASTIFFGQQCRPTKILGYCSDFVGPFTRVCADERLCNTTSLPEELLR